MNQSKNLDANRDKNLSEEIRKELLESLRKKGIRIRGLEVVVKPDSLNVSLNIR